MKSYLPKNLFKTRGFTLIELLIVVSIIAILAVIGAAIYSNSQSGARDAKRRADIDAVVAALDVAKSAANTSTYSMLVSGVPNPVTGVIMAEGNWPTDPSSPTKVYCYATTAPPPPTNPAVWGASCPASPWALLTGATITGNVTIKVCTVLENPTPNVICKVGSLQ